MQDYLPVLMQAGAAIGFATSMLVMSVLLGKKRAE